MSYPGQIYPEDVIDAKSFCKYCQQELGMPMPFVKKDVILIQKGAKEFFSENPAANWGTLCKVVQWAKGKTWRYASAFTLLKKGLPSAYADHFLPELEPGARPEDLEIADRLYAALRVEKDVKWRNKMLLAAGSNRYMVLEEWIKNRPELVDDYLREYENE